jgi:hypothetical protein
MKWEIGGWSDWLSDSERRQVWNKSTSVILGVPRLENERKALSYLSNFPHT